MALTYLEEAFPRIAYSTIEQLFGECGENAILVIDHLTADIEQQPEASNKKCGFTPVLVGF